MSPAVLLETPQGSIPLNYTVEQIPDEPDAQVAATIARMCQYVCADAQTYPIQYDAQQALSLDPSSPLQSIHQFVRSRMKFKRDEDATSQFNWMLKRPGPNAGDDHFVELLKRPVDVSLEYAATGKPVEGDCDDFSMYVAAILRSLGVGCQFATVSANSEQPNAYSHVYSVAYVGKQRCAMDCSHGSYAGWETPSPYGKFCEWKISERSDWAGLGIALTLAGWFAWKHRKEIERMFA